MLTQPAPAGHAGLNSVEFQSGLGDRSDYEVLGLHVAVKAINDEQ